ncbi:hypothetical protein EJ03DRAFT_329695 [Teratosphaeria nubilosa]|uniref:Uncharacterized protein n=1 Tax=Teratosphaeria nubilosa TaxID=161662 RepID=A0A6G1L2W4_9PEZI|nr:hypothetical protein EJ03DRAFT_329695 [Teratosphaeria nubilosa]
MALLSEMLQSFHETPELISLDGRMLSSECFPVELSFRVLLLMITLRLRFLLANMWQRRSRARTFQYGQGHGAARLLRWMVEHTEVVHHPSYQIEAAR